MTRQAPPTYYRYCSLVVGLDESQSLRVRCHLPRTSMWAVSPDHKACAIQKVTSAISWEDAPSIGRDSPVGQPPVTSILKSAACRMPTASPVFSDPLVCQRPHCLSPQLAGPAADLNPKSYLGGQRIKAAGAPSAAKMRRGISSSDSEAIARSWGLCIFQLSPGETLPLVDLSSWRSYPDQAYSVLDTVLRCRLGSAGVAWTRRLESEISGPTS